MGAMANFFEWATKFFTKSLTVLTGFGGMMVVAVTSTIAFIAGLFHRFTWLDDITSYIEGTSQYVSDLMSVSQHSVYLIIYKAIALDRLVQYSVYCLGATFGVTVIMFITMFALMLGLLPSILVCKAVARSIKAASLGVFEP